MVYYPLQTLVNAGIKEVMVVTGGPHAGDFIRVLKNGEDFGLKKLNYGYQEGEGGIADALSMAESFVGGDDCVVILGDNIIADDISQPISNFSNVGGCHIFTKEVHDPERFGVVEYEDTEGSIADIIEKPANPPSNDAVIGLYMYDNTVFDKIRSLDPSERGELEVTDLNRMYLKEGNLTAHRIKGTWIDCGTIRFTSKSYTKILQ